MQKNNNFFTAFFTSGIVLLATSFLIFSNGYSIHQGYEIGTFLSLVLHVMIFVRPFGTVSFILSLLLFRFSFKEYKK